MKNIIFLTYLNLWSLENKKGAPSFYKTIEAYLNNGWNVTLVNPKYNNGETPNIPNLKVYTFDPFFYEFIKLKKIGFFARILHALQGNYYLYKLGKTALEDYKNQALIYSYEVHGVNAGRKISKKYNLPFITRFQGTVLSPLKDNVINKFRKYPHFDALKTKANVTIMTDDGTQGEEVLKRLGNQSDLVKFWRNGVDIDTDSLKDINQIMRIKNDLGIKESDKVLITVSRLAAWKKVDRAIKALSFAIQKNPDIKLVIVGDGDEKQNLKKYANSLGLANNVIFVGAIDQNKVKNYLDMADVFLSLYDLSNVGNPLLEAMSCGKPIITLDVGDTKTIINKKNNNGILLKLNELDDIPDYIIKLIEDKEFSDLIAENAKEYARRNFWSWDNRMHEEIKLIEGICGAWRY